MQQIGGSFIATKRKNERIAASLVLRLVHCAPDRLNVNEEVGD